jgi:cytochrome c peroxidase
VVDHYNQEGVKNLFLDNQIIPLNLTESEKQDLIEMLHTLNGEGWQHASSLLSFPE